MLYKVYLIIYNLLIIASTCCKFPLGPSSDRVEFISLLIYKLIIMIRRGQETGTGTAIVDPSTVLKNIRHYYSCIRRVAVFT